jgi:hypothetical protein
MGGLIDVAGGVIYLRQGPHAIQAVDLRTGEIRWESPAAFLPLAVTDAWVAALALHDNKRVLTLFDPQGELRLRSEPLPENAWFIEGPASGSSVTGDVDESWLVVRWVSQKHPFGGAASSFKLRTVAVGEAKVDLESGQVNVLRDELFLPAEVASAPQDPSLDATPEFQLPAQVARELEGLAQKVCWPPWHVDSKLQPLVVGDRLTVVCRESAPGGAQLVLQSWDRETGQPADPTPLIEGRDLNVMLAQGDCLFVQNVTRSPTQEQRSIHVFSLASGQEVGRLPYARAVWPVCVVGDRLLRTTGGRDLRALESVDLQSGEAAWTRGFYQYNYNGPQPPTAPNR